MGVLVAIGIFSSWLLSLIILLPLHWATTPLWLIVADLLGRTFLQTGLFIIAHDAMHGSLIPGNRKWNDLYGRIAVWCYGCLPYEHCRRNHHKHHAVPGQIMGDPDFHDGLNAHPFRWYLKFIGEYLPNPHRAVFICCWGLIFFSSTQLLQVSYTNFLVFGIIPLFISSIQLFFFGTYLPHRAAPGIFGNSPQIQSIDYPIFWSLLACYHFGYHREHHQYPQTPWYALPSRRESSVPL
jgi:beta-carotene ketolase (CrtW type)